MLWSRSVLQQKQNWKKWNSRIEDAIMRLVQPLEKRIVAGVVRLLSMSSLQSQLLNWKDEATDAVSCFVLEEPVRQIAHNAGYEDYCDWSLKNAEVGTGFNAATGEWVNMIDAGIDPVKWACPALQNAASVASLDLDDRIAVANKPEPSSPSRSETDPSMMGDDVTWYQWLVLKHRIIGR